MARVPGRKPKPDREQRIVIRLRTHSQAETLGPALDHAYAIDEDACFDKMLKAIDEAERQVWGDGEPEDETDG